ncbi:MAG TPA: efflux transporter outer membrane subunit [Steroidobacteraceae bacterium]
MRIDSALVPALVVLSIAGCAVGPDFKPPAAPNLSGYSAESLTGTPATPNVVGGDAQRFAAGADLPGDWWTLFHSRALNELIERALANNHDLKAAQAALSAAHENVLAQRAAYYPSLGADFSASRQRQPASLAPVPANNQLVYDLFTPQLNISYVPDVFGLNRRTVESLQAQAQSVRFQMLATYTTLTSNVVVTAIQASAMDAQIDATRDLITLNSHGLEILNYQLHKGYASGVDVAAQESQLAQVTATLPPLIKQSQQLHHLLAVLTGRFPSAAPADPFELSSLQLPADLPVSMPAQLVAQRPDVRQAQENLHAASAQIGIAIANRLPNITLSADVGSTGLAISQVFSSGTGFWGLAGDVSAPIFEGGKLLHQERAAKAAYTQAAEQYRSTVLTAVQNVADTLTALQQDAEALKATAAAEHAAKTTLDLAQRQVHDGYAGDLALLSAEQAYQQARLNLIQAQASRYADTAALFQALGGGWWRRAELTQTHGN